MRRLMWFAAMVLVAGELAVAVAWAAGPEELKPPMTVGGEHQAVYSAAVRGPGRGVDSVLTNPRGAVTGTKGTGWLLHSGTQQHDTCERVDATSGLRMVCVAW